MKVMVQIKYHSRCLVQLFSILIRVIRKNTLKYLHALYCVSLEKSFRIFKSIKYEKKLMNLCELIVLIDTNEIWIYRLWSGNDKEEIQQAFYKEIIVEWIHALTNVYKDKFFFLR